MKENNTQYNIIFKGLWEKLHGMIVNTGLACVFIPGFKSQFSWKGSASTKQERKRESTQYFKRLSYFFMDDVVFRLD